jgi:pimeloyl-ACP methyl ester carboxylesterase
MGRRGRATTLLLGIAAAALARPAGAAPRLETVTYAGDSATFVATLALPGRPGRAPAVVLLHGSERGVRDGAPARRLRERLLPRGIAVLSFDKRGVGGSTGRYRELPDLREAAGDGLAAVRCLLERAEIDTNRIGVIGSSQGGWVGPLMATLSPRVAFVVSVSGPGVTPMEQGRYQDGARLLEAGLDAGAVAEVDSLRAALNAYWLTGAGADEARARWSAAITRPWFDVVGRDDPLFSRLGRPPRPPTPGQMPAEYLEFLDHGRYDPVATSERVRVPVLHVYGAADRHVPVAESIRRLRGAYQRGGNRRATFVVFPHAGHGLQTVAGDHECLRCPRDTTASAPRFAPGAWERVDRWIVDRVRPGPR